MIGIEQLTLPEHYATIPNAANFSCWEHITGSPVLVKLLVEKWNNENPTDRVSNRELVVFMLRTMLSDIGHTIGSHLGDWIMRTRPGLSRYLATPILSGLSSRHRK